MSNFFSSTALHKLTMASVRTRVSLASHLYSHLVSVSQLRGPKKHIKYNLHTTHRILGGKMVNSDNSDIGMMVTSIGVILAIIGFVLVVFFAVFNPSVHPGTTPIQIQKVYASVGFLVFGLVLIPVGDFISKR